MTHPEHPSPVPVAARPFQGRPAGIVTRLSAGALDLLVVLGVVAVFYGAVAAFRFLLHPRSFSWPDNTGWSLPVIGFVIAVPYLALTWRATGRSYGDALLGLRVIGPHGARVGVLVAIVRAVLCVLFPIGLLWVVVSTTNRSVQDLLLRTSVIYDWTPHT